MTDRTHPDSGRITGGIVEMLQARIAELEAQLEAIGAGGVSPLIGQPQAMPDLSQLTERGAVAWAGVDAQGLREGGADMSKERDLMELVDAYAEARHIGGCHTYNAKTADARAKVVASLQSPGFDAADMATAAAQGFRDGVASVAANAGEPQDRRQTLATTFRGLSDRAYCDYIEQMRRDVCLGWEYKAKHGKFGEAELEGHTKAAELFGRHRAFSEASNALQESLATIAAPPTAQAEGGRLVPVEPTQEMIDAMRSSVWLPACYRAMLAAAPCPPTSAEGVEHG